jgi:hypothetical protein
MDKQSEKSGPAGKKPNIRNDAGNRGSPAEDNVAPGQKKGKYGQAKGW